MTARGPAARSACEASGFALMSTNLSYSLSPLSLSRPNSKAEWLEGPGVHRLRLCLASALISAFVGHLRSAERYLEAAGLLTAASRGGPPTHWQRCRASRLRRRRCTMEKLADACRNGDLATIQAVPADELWRLCRKQDEDGRSLLHSAAASGNLELVQYLVDHGAASQLNVADEDGWVHAMGRMGTNWTASLDDYAPYDARWTALTSAVSAGREDVVRCLLSLGAEVDAPTTSGRTPLHYACSKGQTVIAELLLKVRVHRCSTHHRQHACDCCCMPLHTWAPFTFRQAPTPRQRTQPAHGHCTVPLPPDAWTLCSCWWRQQRRAQ